MDLLILTASNTHCKVGVFFCNNKKTIVQPIHIKIEFKYMKGVHIKMARNKENETNRTDVTVGTKKTNNSKSQKKQSDAKSNRNDR